MAITRQELRELISDQPKYRYDSKTADGTATKYQVSKFPIVPNTGTITAGGVLYGTSLPGAGGTSRMTLNGTSGIADFLGTAIGNGTSIIAEYTCTQIDGTTLDNVIYRNGSIKELCCSEAGRIKAAQAADYYSFTTADIKVDKKGITKHWLDWSKAWEDVYYDPDKQPVVDTQVQMEYMDQESVGD